MSDNTLTLPKSSNHKPSENGFRRGKWGDSQARKNFGPKGGHQTDLTRLKGKANISLTLMTSGDGITGLLCDSDRYTVTVAAQGVKHVFFKHAIESYSLTELAGV